MHRSSISSHLKTKVLFKGMLYALLGIFPLLVIGVFTDIYFLKSYGLATFLLCVLCITWGLKPYKTLNKLSLFPYELEITDETVTLFKNKKALVSFRLKEITKFTYIKTVFFHGIGIKIDTPNIEIERVRLPQKFKSKKSFDLILPYFSERVFQDLENHIKDLNEPHHASEQDQ